MTLREGIKMDRKCWEVAFRLPLAPSTRLVDSRQYAGASCPHLPTVIPSTSLKSSGSVCHITANKSNFETRSAVSRKSTNLLCILFIASSFSGSPLVIPTALAGLLTKCCVWEKKVTESKALSFSLVGLHQLFHTLTPRSAQLQHPC